MPKKEERIKAERIAAWRKGLLELTDIEIYELALKTLANRLDAYRLAIFIMHHFKKRNAAQTTDQPLPISDRTPDVIRSKRMPASETQD